jgi:uncharacterized protein
MNSHTLRHMVAGPAGLIECAIDMPPSPLLDSSTVAQSHGTVVLCHPHPQHGGTMDNKVVQTLVRAFVQLGWRTVRFNFRGVGASQGEWGGGLGEIEDALAVIQALRQPDQAFMLAGFSFGAYVASEVALRLSDEAKPLRMVLIGPSTQRQIMPAVPAGTVVIHGELDEIVPLAATLNWARPQSLPVLVFPGVGHFFHGQLGLLKNTVVQALQVRTPL